MAKYRKVYDHELLQLYEAIQRVDLIKLSRMKDDTSFMRFCWTFDTFFRTMVNRPELEDEE